MVLDSETYILTEDNYNKIENKKTQIVIGHTFSKDMSFFNGWKNRMNGKFKKTSPFTIDITGIIYNHYSPKYYSDFIGFDSYDLKSIPILLVNEGWLVKDVINNQYIDWIGNIYNREDKVVERRWRSHTYWAPYTERQIKSLVKLINYLCDEFDIEKKVVEHNTQVYDIDKFEGVVFKSNYNKNTTDLSPAWNYNIFKQVVENE